MFSRFQQKVETILTKSLSTVILTIDKNCKKATKIWINKGDFYDKKGSI